MVVMLEKAGVSLTAAIIAGVNASAAAAAIPQGHLLACLPDVAWWLCGAVREGET